MTLFSADITKLSSIPNIKCLLIKAGFKKSNYDPLKSSKVILPSNKFYCDRVVLDKPNYRLYHQVIGWDLDAGIIHPCYLHSLAFPLHIKLLLQAEFPFPLLGLVHINNQISQIRPIKKSETLSVTSCFGQLELHPKGWAFSIKVKFYSGSELVWQSISSNLFRCNHGRVVEPTLEHVLNCFTKPIDTIWKLNANLGRRYAKVSGDFNPIHLSKWSAKLFGFKRHIIHGMWTKSYCVSELQKINPSLFLQAFEINTSFKQPLYLPSQVNLAVQLFGANNTPAKMQFKVSGLVLNNPGSLHLIGDIRPI
tara:strand:+ start:2679 stop:3602 length:924 start_codon:yes stop_codon:yes gene_type:complete